MHSVADRSGDEVRRTEAEQRIQRNCVGLGDRRSETRIDRREKSTGTRDAVRTAS